MEFLRRNNCLSPPEVSIILSDWSVRESFHTLEYLNRQRIDRSLYEIIWIEFYDRRAKEIEMLIKRYENLGLPSCVDTWIVMDSPRAEFYHKHRLYNVGILNSLGRVVTIMDSDAIVKTTFVKTIIEEFKKNSNLILHMEEIRNFDKRFYPFNYPPIEEIVGPGCVNAVGGVPIGLNASVKSLKKNHRLWNVYNYGSCFSAMRKDVIRIGGADEHTDYVGHICGPYEMTARLINAGVCDELHSSHYLYHVWHPNQGGEDDYCGPSDGKGMSTTAVEILKTGRIFPLVENEEIKRLRLAQKPSDSINFSIKTTCDSFSNPRDNAER